MIYQTLAKVFLICSGGVTNISSQRLFGDLPPRIENDGRDTGCADPDPATGSGRRDRSRECDRIHPRQRRASLACHASRRDIVRLAFQTAAKALSPATPGLPRKAKAGTAPRYEPSGTRSFTSPTTACR